jgi:hypothetical protein
MSNVKKVLIFLAECERVSTKRLTMLSYTVSKDQKQMFWLMSVESK